MNKELLAQCEKSIDKAITDALGNYNSPLVKAVNSALDEQKDKHKDKVSPGYPDVGSRKDTEGKTGKTSQTDQKVATDEPPVVEKETPQTDQKKPVDCIGKFNKCQEECSQIRGDCIKAINSPSQCKSCGSKTCQYTYDGYWCNLHSEWLNCIEPVLEKYHAKLEDCNRVFVKRDLKDRNRGPDYGKCLGGAHELMAQGWKDCYERACKAYCDESGQRGQVTLRPARCKCE